jgi:hypothetical protein
MRKRHWAPLRRGRAPRSFLDHVLQSRYCRLSIYRYSLSGTDILPIFYSDPASNVQTRTLDTNCKAPRPGAYHSQIKTCPRATICCSPATKQATAHQGLAMPLALELGLWHQRCQAQCHHCQLCHHCQVLWHQHCQVTNWQYPHTLPQLYKPHLRLLRMHRPQLRELSQQ